MSVGFGVASRERVTTTILRGVGEGEMRMTKEGILVTKTTPTCKVNTPHTNIHSRWYYSGWPAQASSLFASFNLHTSSYVFLSFLVLFLLLSFQPTYTTGDSVAQAKPWHLRWTGEAVMVTFTEVKIVDGALHCPAAHRANYPSTSCNRPTCTSGTTARYRCISLWSRWA